MLIVEPVPACAPVFVVTVVPVEPRFGFEAMIWFRMARVAGPTRPTASR
jgi:hypothetical protein